MGFPEIYLSVVLLLSGVIDYQKHKIPNYLTFPTVITAIVYHCYMNGLAGLWFSFSGLFAGIAILIIPYAMGGMGAGDVKLLGAVGSFVGYKSVFVIFLFTAIFGGIYAVFFLIKHEGSLILFLKKAYQWVISTILIKKYVLDTEQQDNEKPRLCYGIAIAMGGFSYIGLTMYGVELS